MRSSLMYKSWPIFAACAVCLLLSAYTYVMHSSAAIIRGATAATHEGAKMRAEFQLSSYNDSAASSPPARRINTNGISGDHAESFPAQQQSNKSVVLARLDDEIFDLDDVGFPPKPLTIEEVRLCDREMQPFLKGSMYSCPDPTCLKCNKADQNRKRKLIEVLRSEERMKKRISMIKTKFKPKSAVTVMTVNTGQIHLFLNWVCSCERHGIEVRDSTLMVPTDRNAANIIERNNFTILPLDWITELGFTIDAKYEGADQAGWNPHMQGHSDINSVTVIVANDLVQNDYTLLLHDVDIVWQIDPRDWLRDAAIQRDCLAMFAPRWDSLGVANSGFVWMVANKRTKIFMQTLENLLPVKGISDQQLWNALLRHHKFRQIGFRVLPLLQFQLLYDHTLRKWNQIKDKAIVVHGVSHRKTYRLAKANLWFFDEKCSAYTKDLVPCGGDFMAPSCKI